MRYYSVIAPLALVSLALTAPLAAQSDAPPAMGQYTAVAVPPLGPASDYEWNYTRSDVPVDPAWTFGTLPNGMRYALRHNETPAGTALVRLRIGSGSLEEHDDERGLAHYLEHMAFNGSAKIPEGEMVKLLERKGLAFGADTNASTGFETTTYKLDLPRTDGDMIDTALMLMRETASNLTLSPAAVEREQGVILAEKRDRNTFALRATEDSWQFLTPDARYTQRLPIGIDETIRAADPARLRGFYKRTYVPANTVLIVVGDIDVAKVEAKIRSMFGVWQPSAPPSAKVASPIDTSRKGLSHVYLDPALSERVTVSRLSRWRNEPDTIAQRQQNLLRQVGYAIVNRRLAQLVRTDDPPFRAAGFGSNDLFQSANVTGLTIDTVDGGWQTGLDAAAKVWRQSMIYGFTGAEVAEQVARLRAAQVNAANSQDTRSNAALVNAMENLLRDGLVPSTPQSSLERFEAFAPAITPVNVLAALRQDAAPLDDPLIRFQGRTAPAGGADALRQTWDTAIVAPVAQPEAKDVPQFGYDDFGTPGTVVSDTISPVLGIREIRFANGVRLNLKQTDLQKDRIAFRLSLDGGDLLNTAQEPLTTAMVSTLPLGGLGKHSQDEIESIFAGRTVSLNIQSRGDAFVMDGTTVPEDMSQQLDLLTAAITDPGYRREGEVRYQRSIANFFKQKDATPASALGTSIGGILSNSDPRFSLQPQCAYEALSFHKLRYAIADRLEHGAIELALVGDFDQQAVIAQVARTLGALPARETEFRDSPWLRQRPFTDKRTRHTIYHTGESDQALIGFIWPTVGDRDPAKMAQFELLERIVKIELQDELRERLGKTYSPDVSSSISHLWIDYGTFSLAASVDVKDLDVTRASIAAVLRDLSRKPISSDLLKRARQPLLEDYANALKTNGGWLRLVDRAQTQPELIERFEEMPKRLKAVTHRQLRQTAGEYLTPNAAVEVVVVPAVSTEKSTPSTTEAPNSGDTRPASTAPVAPEIGR
ncbi:MAG: M16 family metallopeptidase [Tsuneonella suprasediminis]|uniref:Insulinase family protein n=1 Tax=Tsuneonella suprasediminis TaxID=2306996 RepID=A0A419R3A6_9SPHN|nr:M16 family metallopeptidase [Tsuneonella suprasediminis]RJX68504.1 insulinase family protein [Tsuneonella suprasediminis]UBS31636.1 insulinase family protein [Altererythrobacter sp. N1]